MKIIDCNWHWQTQHYGIWAGARSTRKVINIKRGVGWKIPLLLMRDIKQIYHSLFRGTSWIYGPSVPSTVLFSEGRSPSENSTVEGTSEPIDSTSHSQEWYICILTASVIHYTGWPPQKWYSIYFPQYVDAITGISVWGNLWEKWYQDQQFWFSSLFSRSHFVRQCQAPNLSLFSLNKMWMNAISACHSSEYLIQLTLSMCILYIRNTHV